MENKFINMYQEKLISAEHAAGLVESGMTIHYNGSANVAAIVDKYLARRKDELQNVKVRSFLDTVSYEVCKADPKGDVFKWQSGFILPFSRPFMQQRGIGPYACGTWHIAGSIIKTLNLDIFFVVTAPMDDSGYFNFGLTAAESALLADQAKKIVVIVRKDMPAINGGDGEGIHISKVAHIVEDNEFQTFALNPVPSKPEDEKIAENILKAGLIHDGSTIQIGIGSLPNSMLNLIKDAGLKHCGLHTEMLTEKMLDLIESGVVDNSRKERDKYKTVFSFCLGSRKLYDAINNNPSFATYPVDYVNHPFTIASQPDMFSLNSALQVDLTGQVASEQSGGDRPAIISGTGGQLDFVLGTMLSKDQKGISVIALYSRHKGKSRVVPMLEKGMTVTVPRSIVHHIATEWGVACLKGLTVDLRAKALISIAHPEDRDELYRQAEEAGIISYKTYHTGDLPPGVLYLNR